MQYIPPNLARLAAGHATDLQAHHHSYTKDRNVAMIGQEIASRKHTSWSRLVLNEVDRLPSSDVVKCIYGQHEGLPLVARLKDGEKRV